MIRHCKRLLSLYRDGGTQELQRGIRDFIIHDTPIPVHRVVGTAMLSVSGVSVEFNAVSDEAIWRGYGHGETATQADFVRAVRPSDTVWDVGANLGTYALLAGDIGADVVAFEPGDAAREQLRANAELNGVTDRITAVDCALSDHNDTAVLTAERRSGVREITHDGRVGDVVPVRRGDGLGLPSPDVLKVDVEGTELAVLDGMGDMLSEPRVCYVEVHDGVDETAVIDRLVAAGFEKITESDGILQAR